MRTSLVLRLPRRLALVSFVFLTSTAGMCELLEPSDPYEGVEGTWTLTSIGNAPIPAAGYALNIPDPTGGSSIPTGYKMHGGSLQFSQPSSGSVVAEYRISKDGLIEPEAFYTGSFVYDGKGKVTLSTLKKESVEGDVTFESGGGNVFQPEGTLVINQLVWVKEPGTGLKVPVPVNVTLVRPRLNLDD